MKLDQLLPEYDFNEVHTITLPVPPHQAYTVFHSMTMADIRLTAPLFFLRELPARLAGRMDDGEKQGDFRSDSKLTVGNVYYDVAGEETVFGFIGQPWKLVGGEDVAGIRTAAEFIAFSQPDYVKVAANIAFQAVDGGTLVSTESRIAGTNRSAWRRFLPYWMVIRLPSGFIRRCMLSALKRKVGQVTGGSLAASGEGKLP